MNRESRGSLALRLIGAAVTIAAIGWLAHLLNHPMLITSFGGSSVLVFLFEDRPFSQPRALIGGHVLSALAGLAVMQLIGTGPIALGLGVVAAIALMMATRTLHPPAAADPLIAMTELAGWSFVLAPVLAGSLVVTAGALLTHRIRQRGSYPVR